MHHRVLLSFLLLAPPALAQHNVIAPAGSDVQEGNDNNTIPFWSLSATYQQIHDAVDMSRLNAGMPMLIMGMGFRKDYGGGPTPGRMFDVQITCNSTTVSSQTITTSFATNLGTGASVVLPYTQVNLPALNDVSKPNPPGLLVPFNQPFVYVPASGNFVWEWRIRNATSSAWTTLDAVQGANSIIKPNEGSGCIASGQSQPASITAKSWAMSNGAYNDVLSRGPVNAPAALFLSILRQPLMLPGMCSRLELAPMITLPGTTNGSGSWSFNATLPDLRGTPQVDLLAQFAFLDAGLALGLGVSDMSVVSNPLPGTYAMSRCWYGLYNSGGGNENGTTGNLDTSYGLVTVFKLP